jgi:hypothetical protein
LRRPERICDHRESMRRRAFGAGILGLLLVFTACGGSDGSSDGAGATAGSAGSAAGSGTGATSGTAGSSGGATTPDSQFLTDYAAAVCALYEPCCIAETQGFDRAGCTSWFSRVTDAYWDGDYQADTAAACLEALAAAHADDPDRCHNVALFDEATFYAECAQAFTPSAREGAAPGEVCMGPGNCARAAGENAVCYGNRCVREQRGVEGDGPCTLVGVEPRPTEAYKCEPADGLYCNRESNTCAPFAGDEERCPFPDACGPDALCSGGFCHRLPKEAEECLNAVQGAGGFCAVGFVCDASSLLCRPGPTLGQECGDEGCSEGVCLDGTCTRSDFLENLNCTG